MKYRITKPVKGYEYGDIVDLDDTELDEFPYNATLEKVESIDELVTVNYVDIHRQELGKLKMKKLQEIGNGYGVKDTKKSELIEEIIQARKDLGEL